MQNGDESVAYLPKIEFMLPNGEPRSFYSQTGSNREDQYVIGQQVEILFDPFMKTAPLLRGHEGAEKYTTPGMFLFGVACLFAALILTAVSIGDYTGILEHE